MKLFSKKSLDLTPNFYFLSNFACNLTTTTKLHMKAHASKIVGEGLTYDDVLLIPNYSDILPRDVSIKSKFSRNITLNVPIASAAMDTVTESSMAIAMAQEGGIGVLHKNMTIEQQAAKVETISNEAGATTAEPSTRKSLFGGLGRPSNH